MKGFVCEFGEGALRERHATHICVVVHAARTFADGFLGHKMRESEC